ncbi:A disintegrin and metalloproteinase with thrombospondin motifs 2-like isoform X2 [Mercenaria mercenaria]|uniref:A disintegrin and metalloproteinase with thrombospondin motifs 2-like isoform X2 n=1 Tax=Mercenaria mercenaria TaxID=6596 RepID=UPI00234EE25F|nr:A disintegrin and metalloproteinase with thrombospondin motifs 2-like isoform X2 [Mercenaria mercenaria]
MLFMKGILLLYVIRLVKVVAEIAWLEDINNDNDKRNLDMGLPEILEFNLKRDNGGTTKLQLQENKRVSPNAPVYITVVEEGKQNVVKIDTQPIAGTKYYLDKKTGSAVQVSCKNQPLGPCHRTLEGMLHIKGLGYEIRPSSGNQSVRNYKTNQYIPHEIKRFVPTIPQPMPKSNDSTNLVLGPFGTSYVRKPDADIEDNGIYQGKSSQIKFTKKTRRRREATKEYTIEITVLIDRFYWKKYLDISTANNGMNQNEATMYRIRRRIAMMINGISLIYSSIDDPEITIHISLAAIVLNKNIDNDNTIPTWNSITVLNGMEFIDCVVYTNQLAQWSKKSGLPGNDHLMLMTGLNLFTGSASYGNGVLGIAWINGLCSAYRNSVVEDIDDFFTLTTVATHEVGHNIGAFHDGYASSTECTDKDKFIMAPHPMIFSKNTPYTKNPWRFSQCAINAFKTNMAVKSRCLGSSDVKIYDLVEYNKFTAIAPGELYTTDEQCQMIVGQSSYCCQEKEDEDVCRRMTCFKYNCRGYVSYTAARGTPCGDRSLNKWCFEGQCVSRPAPTTTTSCADNGWKGWTCERISRYFEVSYSYLPSYWCQDEFWSFACCAFCLSASRKLAEKINAQTELQKQDCVDKGYLSWQCSTVSAYFMKRYGVIPQKWCLDPDWEDRCCAYCANYSV